MGRNWGRERAATLLAWALVGLGCAKAPEAESDPPAPEEPPYVPSFCGDGKVAAGEACDDGNTVDDDACPNDCVVCGDGLTQGREQCDDGNTAQGDGCFNCQTPDKAIWSKTVSGSSFSLHPNGNLYALDGAGFDVLQFDPDGKLLATWPGPLTGFDGANTWSSSGAYALNDGGVLVQVGLGRGAVERHLARYSSSGDLQWAVWLAGTSFQNGNGWYVYAATALGHTIAIAGLEHLGATGVGNSAQITLLDPDGVQVTDIRYAFQGRETQANDVLLVSDNEVCAGGEQWVASDDERRSGWAACWTNGVMVWERSFDKQVLHLRLLDAASLDVLTTGSWNTVELADGATSNRREGTFGSLYYTAVLGENTLSTSAAGASLFDPTGAVRWSSAEPVQTTPVGLTPSGTAYFTGHGPGPEYLTTLARYETGVTSTPDPLPAPTLAAPTLDLSKAGSTCHDYCKALVEAKCPFKNRSSSIAECATVCVRDAACEGQMSTLTACLKDRGALTCAGGVVAISGCDAESAAYEACATAAP